VLLFISCRFFTQNFTGRVNSACSCSKQPDADELMKCLTDKQVFAHTCDLKIVSDAFTNADGSINEVGTNCSAYCIYALDTYTTGSKSSIRF
jgi:hypothetical protein